MKINFDIDFPRMPCLCKCDSCQLMLIHSGPTCTCTYNVFPPRHCAASVLEGNGVGMRRFRVKTLKVQYFLPFRCSHRHDICRK